MWDMQHREGGSPRVAHQRCAEASSAYVVQLRNQITLVNPPPPWSRTPGSTDPQPEGTEAPTTRNTTGPATAAPQQWSYPATLRGGGGGGGGTERLKEYGGRGLQWLGRFRGAADNEDACRFGPKYPKYPTELDLHTCLENLGRGGGGSEPQAQITWMVPEPPHALTNICVPCTCTALLFLSSTEVRVTSNGWRKHKTTSNMKKI